MEIKVQCDCGQKFKFDVEPVNGRMPFVVNCPVCGADGTARANVILQQLLPPPAIAAAMIAPPPVAAAPPAPAPMRPAGLGISRPAALKPVTPTPDEAAEESEAEEDSSDEVSVRETKVGWKVWLIIAFFVCWGIVGTLSKLSRDIAGVRDLVAWVKGLAGGGSDEETTDEKIQVPVLFAIGEGTLLFKHDNQTAVAEACAEFWTGRFNQKLNLSAPTNCLPDESALLMGEDFAGAVLPATNGVVEIIAPYPVEDKLRGTLIAMCEFVSRKLQCTNVCAFEGEDVSLGTFIVYDGGTPRFRCDRSMSMIGRLEKVKLDGEAWAKGIGFKPGKAGFKGFDQEDAEGLTKHLGFQPINLTQPVACIILSSKARNP